MKTYMLMVLILVSQTSVAAFKVSVKEAEKPQVKVEKTVIKKKPVSKPPVNKKVLGSVASAKQGNTLPPVDTVNQDNKNFVDDDGPKLNERKDRDMVAQVEHKQNVPNEAVARNPSLMQPVGPEVDDKEVSNQKVKSRYDELMAIREKNMKLNSESAKPVTPPKPLVSENQMLKPLLIAKMGSTVEEVLTKWAMANSYKVVYELGIWDRIKEMKLSTNASFDSSFEVAVEEFLNALNGLKQLQVNDVYLNGCLYPNKYVVIKANQECME